MAAEPAPAPELSAAAEVSPAVSRCNGTDNVGGLAVGCHTTVTNNLDLATGETSSSTTVEECHGAANAALTCTTSTLTSDQVVTSVDQCNGSGNGGGGTVTCSVEIVNNITGTATRTPITVNQCNTAGTGGGTEPTVACDPFPASTTDATVIQCNEAGTGGGGTLRVQCTVRPGSTEASALPVTVDQCNGSGNGGGGYVTCTVSVTNNIITPPPVVIPPVEVPPAVIPPVEVPPAVIPPVEVPPAVIPPVEVPPAVIPPVEVPPAVTPPSEIVGPPVVLLVSSTPTLTPVAPVAVGATPSAAAGNSAVAVGSGRSTWPLGSSLPRSPQPLTGLALTGSDTTTMVALALIAMIFGSLVLLLSRRPTSRRRPDAGL